MSCVHEAIKFENLPDNTRIDEAGLTAQQLHVDFCHFTWVGNGWVATDLLNMMNKKGFFPRDGHWVSIDQAGSNA